MSFLKNAQKQKISFKFTGDDGNRYRATVKGTLNGDKTKRALAAHVNKAEEVKYSDDETFGDDAEGKESGVIAGKFISQFLGYVKSTDDAPKGDETPKGKGKGKPRQEVADALADAGSNGVAH